MILRMSPSFRSQPKRLLTVHIQRSCRHLPCGRSGTIHKRIDSITLGDRSSCSPTRISPACGAAVPLYMIRGNLLMLQHYVQYVTTSLVLSPLYNPHTLHAASVSWRYTNKQFRLRNSQNSSTSLELRDWAIL